MRRSVGLLPAAALIITALSLVGAWAPTEAGTKCARTDPLSGVCTLYVNGADPISHSTNPSQPSSAGSGHACYWDGTAQGIMHPPPGPVPCKSWQGYWSNTYACYISLMKPQPPAGNPAWKGHQPGDGAVYNCNQPQTGILIAIWSHNAPANSGSGPTPVQVAQLAIKRMNLSAITIGIAPKPGPNSIGLVGMPVWMWAKRPGPNAVGPITTSASAGGITITATAKVLHVTWDMGDGTQVVCLAAGTPYRPSYGRKSSPDCGHIYMKSSSHEPGQTYTVTATSSWIVRWTGAGQRGVIRLGGLTRSTQIRIGEAQVLVS